MARPDPDTPEASPVLSSMPARPRRPWYRRSAPWIAAASVVMLISCAVAAFHSAVTPKTAPSCAWADVAFFGGTPAQRGVSRCYLRALAEHSSGGMEAVTDEFDSEEVRAVAFRFSSQAASGVTRVTIRPNDVDSADAEVDLVFADGRRDVQELDIADPTSSTDWRFRDVNEHSSQSETT